MMTGVRGGHVDDVDLVVEAGRTSYDVELTVETWQDGEPFGSRRWTRSIPRDLG